MTKGFIYSKIVSCRTIQKAVNSSVESVVDILCGIGYDEIEHRTLVPYKGGIKMKIITGTATIEFSTVVPKETLENEFDWSQLKGGIIELENINNETILLDIEEHVFSNLEDDDSGL